MSRIPLAPRRTLAAPFIAVALLGAALLPLQVFERPAAHRSTAGSTSASSVLSGMPLRFEATGDGSYLTRGPGFAAELSPSAATFAVDGRVVTMKPVGGSPVVALEAEVPLSGTRSYLNGADPSGWRRGVAGYGQVWYRQVWPGVDLSFHGAGPLLEHDFVVQPGVDPSMVAVEFPGARQVRLDVGGQLLVDDDGRDDATPAARFARPQLYQDVEGTRRKVEGSFVLLGGTRVGYSIGTYDTRHPLVIDPVLLTSTYLGGGGADSVTAVATDSAGAVYIAGSTDSTDFRTVNPVQSRLNLDSPGGPSDAFVAKVDPSGDKLVWATFLGGGSRDGAFDLAVGADGSVVVTGVTESPDFPRAGESPAQGEYGGGPSDAFVARIAADGTALAYSSFLGGEELDSGRGIAVDTNGAVYVTGSTSSAKFPSVNPIRGARSTDDVDAFVTKVNASGSAFVYSTRVGGSSDDHGLDLALTPDGAVVFTGDTRSTNFPSVKALQAGIGGGATPGDANASDAFVAKLDPAGSALQMSTFLGGGDSDQATGIALDRQGSIFVVGNTSSTDFPTAAAKQGASAGDSDAFLTKLDGAATALTYSTYLGGSGADGATGVVVDADGKATVVGVVSSTNFPTAAPVQELNGGGVSDGFVATFDPPGASLLVSTYLGGSDEDQLSSVALAGSDPVGGGFTASTNFATVKAIQQARAPGDSDGVVIRVSLSATAPPTTSAPTREASSSGSDTSGHDRRVQILVALTAVLFLAAVAQTAYLRRRDGAGAGIFASGRSEPLSGPALSQDDDDHRWSSVAVVPPGRSDEADDDHWSPTESPAGAHLADSISPDASFWDLFPDELPPHGRIPGDDEWWAGDLPTEDLLSRRSRSKKAPPVPPLGRTGDHSAGADVLLTELLAGDLVTPEAIASPDADRPALSAGTEADDDEDDRDEGESDGEDADAAATVPRSSRSGSGSGSGSGRRKSRNRRSGRRKRPNSG